jgi:hypothetical protein
MVRACIQNPAATTMTNPTHAARNHRLMGRPSDMMTFT